jgi:transcriptional regulator
MYIPGHYRETDQKATLSFMRKYSFATLITAKDNYPTATHIPFVVNETPEGVELISHVALGNTQWQDFEQHPVLVIFSEPHAYISPSHYESEKNVPTWNYIAVHAYGMAKIINDKNSVFAILETMIETYEKEYKSQWDNLPENYKNKMLKGIVAFKITVSNLQAKKKLSQNKTSSERENIMHFLAESELSTERAVSEYMQAMGK